MKTPRANRRRRTPRRRQRGGDFTPFQQAMGYHLGSDVLHDFGAFYKNYPQVNYHIPGTEITPNEDEVVSYFEADPGIAERIDASTEFTVPKKTTSFASWTPPELHPIGNSSVGIVHDAGDKITKQLGAQNVITFGSVLDPAGKPIDRKDEPIWFNPTVRTVTIPLDIFGFDPTKLTSLGISNFTGNGTCATFNINNKPSIDAVSTKELGGADEVCKQKPINKTTASTAGYFVSIKEAKVAVGRLLVANPRKAMFYLAGKTLGDTMLVASCMEKFGDDVPNPFYPKPKPNGNPDGNPDGKPNGKPDGEWTNLLADGNAVMDAPTQLILKTQDRLNHARALAMGVPSILQSRMGYKYVPAVLSPEDQEKVFQVGYGRLGEALKNRYQYLIDQFKSTLSGEELTPKYSTIAQQQFLKVGETYKLKVAGRIVKDIIGALETLRNRVTVDYDAELKGLTKVDYEKIYKKYNKCAPATADIWDDAVGMHRHIIVSTSKEGPITRKIMIDLMTDFQNIKKLKEDVAGAYQSKGEALRSLFDEAAVGVEVETDSVEKADEEYVNLLTEGAEVIELAPSELVADADYIQENDGSLVNDFINYAGKPIAIGRLQNNAYVIDASVRDELVSQYNQSMGVSINRGGGVDSKPNSVTLLFNAFVCHLNALNVVELNDGSADDPLVGFFKNLESKFKTNAQDIEYEDESGVETDAVRNAVAESDGDVRMENKAAVVEAARKLEAARSAAAAVEGDGDVSMGSRAVARQGTKRRGEELAPALSIWDVGSNAAASRTVHNGGRGGTRRKKRAGTYRKKRKDKGTL